MRTDLRRFSTPLITALLLLLLCCVVMGCQKKSPLLSTWGKATVIQAFKDLPIQDQIKVIPALRETLHENLLTPSPAILEQHKELVSHPEIRINRILNRDQDKFEGFTLGRGGGAYFSFTTQTNDYDQDPDLELQQWRFSSGFAGRNYGHVARLSLDSIIKVTLDDVPDKLVKEDPDPMGRGTYERAKVGVGEIFAVRSIFWDEHDILAAVEVLERDDYGVTFAWRVLKKYTPPILKRK